MRALPGPAAALALAAVINPTPADVPQPAALPPAEILVDEGGVAIFRGTWICISAIVTAHLVGPGPARTRTRNQGMMRTTTSLGQAR